MQNQSSSIPDQCENWNGTVQINCSFGIERCLLTNEKLLVATIIYNFVTITIHWNVQI